MYRWLSEVSATAGACRATGSPHRTGGYNSKAFRQASPCVSARENLLHPVWSVCSLTGQARHEHLRRFVRDHEFYTGLDRDRLRRHATAPEDRDFIGVNGDGLAVGGSAQVGDADRLWGADVDRRTV